MTGTAPMVETQMLIRKPVGQVFNAFIDPDETINFWFTKSTGKLEPGKIVTWEWEMYGVSTKVFVKKIEVDKKILIEWGEPATSVDFTFTQIGGESTYVVIQQYGFEKKGDDLLREINDSTGGFTTVLDGLKAWLEHNIKLNLIADKFPGNIVK